MVDHVYRALILTRILYALNYLVEIWVSCLRRGALLSFNGYSGFKWVVDELFIGNQFSVLVFDLLKNFRIKIFMGFLRTKRWIIDLYFAIVINSVNLLGHVL